jgi:hypothetical protein
VVVYSLATFFDHFLQAFHTAIVVAFHDIQVGLWIQQYKGANEKMFYSRR